MFDLIGRDGLARRGRFTTALHGSFETPNFMPVGTKASVKGVDTERLSEAGAQIMLVNTYHLMLRPGSQLISRLGGIHRFAGWSGPILSDSGGFQVFSLKKLRSMSEEGVEFRSHLDGTREFLSPERAVAIQEELGVDIAMAFDECPPGDADAETIVRSWERTFRWEKRCLDARKRAETAMFGITQGGVYREHRTVVAEQLRELPFDGFAIGGLSVGEPKEQMYDVLSYHPEQLPERKIRYLMGVGTPRDIVEAVSKGVDLFDCVMPTRAGRFGRAYVGGHEPYLNIHNARFTEDLEPLDSNCSCIACRRYSRAYIAHLFRTEEMLGPILLSNHNLTFYLNLMARIRVAIERRSFLELYRDEVERWAGWS